MARGATGLCVWLVGPLVAAAVVGHAEVVRAADAPAVVVHVQLDDQPITPVTVRYLRRVFAEAESRHAQCVVIELNTPGGLLQSTQELVTDILGSDIPVVVYVSPSGARAASAGVFVTLASHVSAMAPGTRIGAAHPVQISGVPFQPPQIPTPSEKDDEAGAEKADGGEPTAADQKIINDTVAWAKSLAQLRGRNAQWAGLAVSESSVLMASEAVSQQVVDVEANNLRELLEKIDGRMISVVDHAGWQADKTLHTAEAAVERIDMWWGERLLAVISNPNVALLLMVFGVYGIILEFYSPGWGVAGTLGLVSLVLGFFGLSILPVNYSGLALVLIALALFVAEAFVTSYGALAIGGIVCLILGGTMLVDSPTGFFNVSLEVLIPISVATAIVTVFLVSQVVKAHRSRVQTGGESLVGAEAIAQDEFAEEAGSFIGQVHVHGEYWRGRSPKKIAKGQHVRIAGRDGLTLLVDQNGKANDQPLEESQTEIHSNVEGVQS